MLQSSSPSANDTMRAHGGRPSIIQACTAKLYCPPVMYSVLLNVLMLPSISDHSLHRVRRGLVLSSLFHCRLGRIKTACERIQPRKALESAISQDSQSDKEQLIQRYSAIAEKAIVWIVLLATLSCSSTSSRDGALCAAMGLA